jgi:two-component system cell cycle sensor histidine kinase/response regulator CckA
MVYGVVDRAQGAIGVESEPGVGARFTLYLPRAAAVAPEPERERQPVTAVPGTDAQTILVAEDEASFRMLLRVVLSEAGYRVLEAADGEAALELARGFDGVIDVLVTDAVMPRMGGPDLIRHLRAIRPETRAIQITGYSDHYLRAADDSQRPDDFIQKPFEPDALLGTIRRVLDRDTSDPWPVGDLAGQSVNADISRS